METWGIYATALGIRAEIVEFTKKEDAEKALRYLKEKYGGKYELIPEQVFESFDEFKTMAEDTEKQKISE